MQYRCRSKMCRKRSTGMSKAEFSEMVWIWYENAEVKFCSVFVRVSII